VIRTLAHAGVLFVTLDNEKTRNALDDAAVAGLRSAFEAAACDESVRALVLRGAHGQFCSGGDFAQFKALIASLPGDPDPIAVGNRVFGRLLQAIVECEVPTIALVEGAAMGGGLGLAAACDVVLATRAARFGTPEVTLGLPPAQIAPFVVRRLGARTALQLLATGARLSADEAHAAGLVDEVARDAAELRQLAASWLDRLGAAEPAALRATKRIVARAAAAGLDAVLDLAAGAFARSLRSGTAEEGIAAFAGKRPPTWRVTLGEWPELP